MKTQPLKSDIGIQQKTVSTFRKKNNVHTNKTWVLISFIEILLGLQLGALLGWPIGWRLGAVCFAIFEPSGLANPEQVLTWYYLPATFAGYGLCIGAVIGAVGAYCYSRNRLKQRIFSPYNQKQTEPSSLVQSLGQTERKIKCPKDTSNTKFSKLFYTENITMKQVNLICTIMLMAFFLFGCLPSLHPIYTDDTVVFDEQLIGKWYGDGGTWSFTKSDDKEYQLRIVEEDGKQATFEVHLVQLGEHKFIDLYPGENMDLENTADIYSCNLVPAHTFMKLELSEPNLNLQWVCLNEIIEEDPNVLKHEQIDDSMLITADSKDIQRVVLENLDEVTAEDEDIELKRCPDLFTKKDIIFDAQLIGHWQDTNGEYLDIIEWNEQGYDIMYSDGLEGFEKMKAVLYQRGHRKFLGLYISPISEEQQKPDSLLIPDFLAEIQQKELELKIWFIDWPESEELLNSHQKLLIGESHEPDCTFQWTL